jgi:hypothetical protein
MVSKQQAIFLTVETFFEYSQSLTEKNVLLLFALFSPFPLSYCCIYASIEKEKISRLSLINSEEFAELLGNVMLTDL